MMARSSSSLVIVRGDPIDPRLLTGPHPARATPKESGRGGDRDSAAGLLAERDVHRRRVELERFEDRVADLDGQRLAEDALVVEAREVELQRLRLEAEGSRLVPDRRRVEVRLARDTRGPPVRVIPALRRDLESGDGRREKLRPGRASARQADRRDGDARRAGRGPAGPRPQGLRAHRQRYAPRAALTATPPCASLHCACSGCGLVWSRAPGWGPGDREFESLHPDSTSSKGWWGP